MRRSSARLSSERISPSMFTSFKEECDSSGLKNHKTRRFTYIGSEGRDGGFGDAAVLEVEILEGGKCVEIKQQVIESVIAYRVSA